eukprot:6483279-Pyramimonas_sp.AAC.1
MAEEGEKAEQQDGEESGRAEEVGERRGPQEEPAGTPQAAPTAALESGRDLFAPPRSRRARVPGDGGRAESGESAALQSFLSPPRRR